MDYKYAPKRIEKKWQEHWEREKLFEVSEIPGREKFYLLEMFPYPSGRIHMGHVRNYSIGDVVARFLRMRGYNVLHPMGWDAFGMPAENAAIKAKTHPARWTYENIAYMRSQLKQLGFSYDWSREFATCDVSYYRWEQLFFLKMYEKGLAYKRSAYVNWCGTCLTVLANEQVEGGACWRCDQPVVQKEMEQWFFKITDYVEELLDYTYRLPGWPERVLTMQQNWIGKSLGSKLLFPLASGDGSITVFTTRADTLFGATFMSLAPEHPLVEGLCRGNPQEPEVMRFVQAAKQAKRNDREAELLEKEGVFTGSCCINPVTGAKMPIYVANFVVMEYGTGAVMAVPAHDQRDFEFARKYGLPVKVVIKPADAEVAPAAQDLAAAFEDDGVLVDSGAYTGMASAEARTAITTDLAEKSLGEQTVQYRLRDWAFHVSVIGALLSRSSIATSVGPFPFPKRICRWFCRRTSRCCPTAPPPFRCTLLSSTPIARAVAVRHAGKRTPWTPSWSRPGILPGLRAQGTTRGRSIYPKSSTGCPWTSTSAASNTRCSTFCIRVSS